MQSNIDYLNLEHDCIIMWLSLSVAVTFKQEPFETFHLFHSLGRCCCCFCVFSLWVKVIAIILCRFFARVYQVEPIKPTNYQQSSANEYMNFEEREKKRRTVGKSTKTKPNTMPYMVHENNSNNMERCWCVKCKQSLFRAWPSKVVFPEFDRKFCFLCRLQSILSLLLLL